MTMRKLHTVFVKSISPVKPRINSGLYQTKLDFTQEIPDFSTFDITFLRFPPFLSGSIEQQARRFFALELSFIELRIKFAVREQLSMGSGFNHCPILQNKDHIGILHRFQVMRDHD